jgi:predicted HicB family RNase H-like nuclease
MFAFSKALFIFHGKVVSSRDTIDVQHRSQPLLKKVVNQKQLDNGLELFLYLR